MKRILEQDGYVDDYPDIFDHVFEGREDLVRQHVKEIAQAPNSNTDNIEAYIDDELKDMISQFNKVESIANMDDLLLKTETEGLVEAL
jgi:ADP-dependent phosphofructokinase/glucokinase